MAVLFYFRVNHVKLAFSKRSWPRSNSLRLRVEDFAAVQKGGREKKKPSFIGITGFVLPLSQLRHMVFNFPSFPCSNISKINDVFFSASPP